MIQTKKKKLIPKLRFPEFREAGEWEVKEVGEIFTVTRGYVLSMNLVNNQVSDATPYPVYSSQTKNNGLSGYYSEFLYEDAITWTTDGANAGDVNYRSGKFYCTNVCGVLINTEGYANLCVASLIDRVAKNHVSYVGNSKLMNGIMSKIRIPIPSFVEQQKIAACLTALDDLISAATERLDALKQHKQGLMQQLFPAEGETVPRLRFPEFQEAGEWVEDSLESFCFSISSGKDKIQNDGDFDLYGSTGIIGRTEKANYDGNFILIARVGANAGTLNRVNGQFGVTDNTLVVNLEDPKKTDFMFYYLNKIGLNKLVFGSGQPLVTGRQLKELDITTPKNPKEQQKIAACLTALDDLIAAQTQKIAKLKTHKRGLMQGLFPKIEN